MAEKPYDLTFEDRGEYHYVCVEAEVINLGLAVDYVNEAIGHLRLSKGKKLLFVREIPEMTSARQYSIVASVIVNMIPLDVRVALVDRSPAHQVVVDVINVEAKEKKRDIRAFESFDEAEGWLLAAGS